MSVTNFNQQIVEDISFVRSILPDHYEVGESKKLGSIHCKSSVGMQDDGFIYVIADHFGERFQEVFHNTCTNHVDFTIYLKPHHQ
jgi:hypothetical protein